MENLLSDLINVSINYAKFLCRVETFNVNDQSPPRLGKRLRVSTTTPVNVNISAANLETMTELIVSWRSQVVLEQKHCQNDEVSYYWCPNIYLSTSKVILITFI